MMMAGFAEIEARMVAVTSERLANAVVTLEGGAQFAAQLDHATADAFDLARAAEITLRWPADSAVLGEGDELVIDGQRYRLAEPPLTLNLHERSVRLAHLGAA